MKVCPTCKSRCFDDMDTCYGCMHQFSNDVMKNEKHKEIKMNDNIPEYFEIDSFPFIEDDNYFRTRDSYGVIKKPTDEKIVIKLEVPKSVLEKYINQ